MKLLNKLIHQKKYNIECPKNIPVQYCTECGRKMVYAGAETKDKFKNFLISAGGKYDENTGGLIVYHYIKCPKKDRITIIVYV